MSAKVGDLVEVLTLPARAGELPGAQRRVYETCVGLKLFIDAVAHDGTCSIKLGQEWHHFPDVEPFDLRFEQACLRLVMPFSDDEWSSLSAWIEADTILTAMLSRVDGGIVASLPEGFMGELVPNGRDRLAEVAVQTRTPVHVRIVRLNRRRHDVAFALSDRDASPV